MSKQMIEDLSLEEMIGFFDRYHVFANQLQTARIEQFQTGFSRIRDELVQLLAEVDEEKKLVAGGFNVFHLLGVAHAEVTTHSAMLANLLDPQGTHAQKHLFLDEFLRVCQGKFPDMPKPDGDITLGRWVVDKEKMTPRGNLDLVVSCRGLGYLLVIENKVWASEQEDQLQRYHQWMQDRQDRYPNQALVFLTPGGYPSWTNAGRPYFSLSYRKDVKAWLEACLPLVKAPRVRETLVQYVQVVEAL